MSKKDLIEIIDRLLNEINDIEFIKTIYRIVLKFYNKK